LEQVTPREVRVIRNASADRRDRHVESTFQENALAVKAEVAILKSKIPEPTASGLFVEGFRSGYVCTGCHTIEIGVVKSLGSSTFSNLNL